MPREIQEHTVNFTYKKFRQTNSIYFKFGSRALPQSASNKEDNYVFTTNVRQVPGRTEIEGNVNLKTSFLDQLASGNYTSSLDLYIEPNPIRNPTKTVYTYRLRVNITVIDTILLQVAPSVIALTYNPNSTINSRSITITSENNWTVISTSSWVTLNRTRGSGTGTISVSADPTGLITGAYESDIVINDGIHSRTVQVTLLVSGINGDNGNDGSLLRVNPKSASITFLSREIPNKTTTLQIESSEDYQLNFRNNLIEVIDTSSEGNIDTLTLRPIQQLFASGVYNETLEINTSNAIDQFFIQLIAYQTPITEIEDNKLFFVDDRNEYILGATKNDTEGLLQFIAHLSDEDLLYTKELPFYRGLATEVLGQEVSSLLESVNPQPTHITNVTHLLSPIRLEMEAFEKETFSSEKTRLEGFTNLLFLNGASPKIENKVSYIPKIVHIPINGILSFSIYSITDPGDVTITGSIEEQISSTTLGSKGIYTVTINMVNLPLTIGNQIEVFVNGISVIANIIPSEKEHNLLIFENEWQSYEVINLTGVIKIEKSKGWESTIKNSRGKQHKKIVEARSPRVFSVNTGKIYSAEEVEWLSRIFDSEKIFLEIKGERIEVYPNISKLPMYETDLFFSEYNLKFTEAIV